MQEYGDRLPNTDLKRLTLTGLSVPITLDPSYRNRTLDGVLPLLSQNASINFLSCVVRLILKKTSLLPSVTLMLRCSGCSSGFGCGGGVGSLSDILRFEGEIKHKVEGCDAVERKWR